MPPEQTQYNILFKFMSDDKELDGTDQKLEDIIDKKKELGVVEKTETSKKDRLKEKSDKKGVKSSKKSLKEVNMAAKTLSITLPLMFGFQQASQSIKSLIDPAMELAGVNSTYQQFLAIKYLPTALEQLDLVLKQGDAWDQQSEDERKTEGNLLLLTKQMMDFVTYAAEMATTFGAIGEILPNIDLTPFGVGIEITGREMGTAAGLAIALSTGLQVMGSESGRTAENVVGFGGAVAMWGSGKMADFLTQVGIANGTDSKGLPKLQTELDKSKSSTETFSSKVGDLFTDLGTIAGDWIAKVISDLTGWDVTTVKKDMELLKAGVKIPFYLLFPGMAVWDALKWVGSKVGSWFGSALGMGDGIVQNGRIITTDPDDFIIATTDPSGLGMGGGQSINSSPTFNISANISSSYDVRQLATELNKYWTSDMERISKQRGMI
jgi:hypothetical protein